MDLSSYYKKVEQDINERANNLIAKGELDVLCNDMSTLENYARNLLAKHKYLDRLEPFDLINSTYVAFFESGASYDIDKFRLCISKVVYEEKAFFHLMQGWGDIEELRAIRNQPRKAAEILVCRQCHEPLNINAFIKKSEGQYDALCSECYSIVNKQNSKAYYGKKKDDSHLKKLRAKACKKYISKPDVKRKHNEKMKEYNRLQKENLTDIYIRQLLRGRGIITSEITEEMIEIERQKLESLRRQAA